MFKLSLLFIALLIGQFSYATVVEISYEEEETDIVNNEALFFAIAGSELIMSLVLGYWTQQIRKDKVYL